MMETVERKETKPEKVGIITLYYNNDNYGGIAQAYALNEYISKLGMDSELISYRRSPVRPIGTKEKIQKDGKCLKKWISFRKSHTNALKSPKYNGGYCLTVAWIYGIIVSVAHPMLHWQ